MIRSLPLAAALSLASATPFITAAAPPPPLGSDAAACEANKPAILATIAGMKDRTGTIRLELYPATAEDFTRSDHELLAAGKTFRRVQVASPASGPVSLCVRVPGPGRYAVLFIHDRDGQKKFDYRVDGAGIPSNKRIGFSKPKVDGAIVSVGDATLPVTIRAQYIGLFGFSPSSAR